ncbi:hypothetical protein VHEMI06663 [[Torrubiella] hemipterigena]|uniref:Uncharacterized protein n=1 Tax=[Torrubiella] hemipterigena TaxID=1531966 RepID=A0A0A1T172_9HYPO|nr:hypothetical protein VHEMI06663 [[Torrubiella] hemipterigena]
MVAYSYLAAAAALVQGSVAAHGHGHARMHIRRDPSTCPKGTTTIQLQPVIVEVLTPILITGHAPGPTHVTIAGTVVEIPDCSGDISQVIIQTGYDTTTLTSTIVPTTFTGPYTTIPGSYGGSDTITVTLPPKGGDSTGTVIVHTPESSVTPISQIGDCTTTVPGNGGSTTVPGNGGSTSSVPGWGGSTSSVPGNGGSTSSVPGWGGSTSSVPGNGGSTSSVSGWGSSSSTTPGGGSSSSTAASSSSTPCTTSSTASSTSTPCTTSSTASSTSKTSSSSVASSTSTPCTTSKISSSSVASSTSTSCTKSKTSSTSTRCTSSSKTTSTPCTTSHKPTPTPCTKCAHKTQPAQPPKACVTTLPKACQKLNQLDGLALVPAAPICLLSLGLYGVGNAAGCLSRDLMSLNSRGSHMVDCLMVAMRDSCITSLPNACSKLSQHNGMALVPEMAKCALELGPLAGGGAGNCLSHSNISPSTRGTGLVACLQSNLLGDGSAGF